MIHVLAIITAKPGKRAELLELFRAIVPTVRAEEGCIEYGPVVDVEAAEPAFGADTYVVVEKWTSRETLKAHAAAQHMLDYGARARDLIATRAIHVLQDA